ncbi:MAG: LysE family translocator [Minwuia sp.]|uniref:LysE family translocator n=1 Tax=Minwuia sp. TaxID=2493630 RepID=UPI003A871957
MLYFTMAVMGLLITPGPGVLSVAGVGAGFGARRGTQFIAGLFVGTNLVGLLVASGLWGIVRNVPYLEEILLGVSLAFLAYLAFRIAFAGSDISFSRATRMPGAVDGLLLQFVNPKAYAVNTTLFGSMPLGFGDPVAEIATKFLIINLIWVPVHFGWLWLGITLKRLDLPPKTQRLVNYAMAVAMLGAVALALVAGSSGSGTAG